MSDRRSTRADLASVASTIEDLTGRVVAAAEGLDADDEQVRLAIYEAERALRTASRRLAGAVRQLG